MSTPDVPSGRPGASGRDESGDGQTSGARVNTPDGPKWTARSGKGSGWGVGGGGGRDDTKPLQTALNGRPGA